MFHELSSRDRGEGCACPPSRACSLRRGGRATWQPQGVGSEAYLSSTSQGEPVLSEAEGTPEDARLPARRAYSSERRTAIPVVVAGDS